MVRCDKCGKEIDVHNDKWERETVDWTPDGKPVISSYHTDCTKTKVIEFEYHRSGACQNSLPQLKQGVSLSTPEKSMSTR